MQLPSLASAWLGLLGEGCVALRHMWYSPEQGCAEIGSGTSSIRQQRTNRRLPRRPCGAGAALPHTRAAPRPELSWRLQIISRSLQRARQAEGDTRKWFKGENEKVSTPQTLATFLTAVWELRCLLYSGNRICNEKEILFFFPTFNPDKEDYWEAIKEIPYCDTDGFKKVLDLSDEHY